MKNLTRKKRQKSCLIISSLGLPDIFVFTVFMIDITSSSTQRLQDHIFPWHRYQVASPWRASLQEAQPPIPQIERKKKVNFYTINNEKLKFRDRFRGLSPRKLQPLVMPLLPRHMHRVRLYLKPTVYMRRSEGKGRRKLMIK